MKKDSQLTIFRSASKFFSGTLLSRISGMLRDMSIAYTFGTESALATFFIAFRFSHLARRLFGEGSLQTAFVPCFEEIRAKDEKQSLYFFRDLTLLLSIGLFCFIILTMGILYFLPSLFSLSIENTQLLQLTSLMLPSLFFICLYGLNTAYLECERSFFTPSIAPIAFNSVWIIAAFLLTAFPPDEAMRWLTLAVVVGCFAQWAFTIPKTYKLLTSKGISFFDNCSPFSKQIRLLAKPLLFANIGVAASQINNALDPLFARFANAEGPAWLWYAIRLQQLPLSLFGIALAGALLPPLSRAAKAEDTKTFNEFLEYAILKTAQFMIPISFATFSLGLSAISLIYGRGHFQEESILGTTNCLWAYSLGLLPMSLILILAPSFYAQNNYKTPLRASLISMGLNLALNAFFVFGLNFSATGVALATSLAAWVNCSLLNRGSLLSKALIPSLISSIAGSLSVAAIDYFYFTNSPTLQVLAHQIPTLSIGFFTQVERFGMQSIAFSSGFLGSIAFMNIPTLIQRRLLKKAAPSKD